MTCDTESTSRPRAAISVATSTRVTVSKAAQGCFTLRLTAIRVNAFTLWSRASRMCESRSAPRRVRVRSALFQSVRVPVNRAVKPSLIQWRLGKRLLYGRRSLPRRLTSTSCGCRIVERAVFRFPVTSSPRTAESAYYWQRKHALDRRQKSHVEHPVSFIEDEHLNLRGLHCGAPSDQAGGQGGDDHTRAGTSGYLSVHVRATNDRDAAMSFCAIDFPVVLFNL